jgi:hypothetical protein
VCLADESEEITSSGEHKGLARPGLDRDLECGGELDDKLIACDKGARETH